MNNETRRHLGIPEHSASWTFLWIFYVLLASTVSLILSFTRPFRATTEITSTVSTVVHVSYQVSWWKYGVNLIIILVILVAIPLSLRYFARRALRRKQKTHPPT